MLRQISSYDRVAIMLCDPPDICATRFFDREDPDKKFMMEQIQRCRGCRYRECFESRLYLGYYYEAVGDLKEAKAQYQEALKRNPHCDEAREALNRLG